MFIDNFLENMELFYFIFGFWIENPFIQFSLIFWCLPLIGGGGGYICPIVVRLIFGISFAFFICFGSGILFLSFEKVILL